jgi:hypothetical protein
MKTFVKVIAVVVLVVVGIGFYRGWFWVSGDRTTETGNVEVKLSVDTDKVKFDTNAVEDSIKGKDSQDEHGNGNN